MGESNSENTNYLRYLNFILNSLYSKKMEESI